MDPNIMKFLEEDEDETMHNGADVEAFTAELNRDMEGNHTSTSQPSDSNSAALSQGSSQTMSQFLPQWQTSGHDESANFPSAEDLMAMEHKEKHSSQLDPQQHGSDSEKREGNDSSNEHKPMPLNPATDACPQAQGDNSSFPASQPMGTQTSGEQSIHSQEPESKPNPEIESQMHNLRNIIDRPPMMMGSNDQQATSMEFKDQQSLPLGKGNQQTTGMGLSQEQVMSAVSSHSTGMVSSSQQMVTPGMSNQQSITSSSQQTGTTLKLNKQVPFGMLLPIIQPQLDKDRAMQLHTLYFKLKKNEISKDGFVRHMRSIVGDQMLKMAVYKLQTQAARNPQAAPSQFQSQPQTSARQMQVPSSAQMATTDSNAAWEVESQADSQGGQVKQLPIPSSGASGQERKHPSYPAQGLNKQQHMHFPQSSFPTYGSTGSSYSPFSATTASSTPLRPQHLDSQMRQSSALQNTTVSHLASTTRAMNTPNISKFDRPHSIPDPKKIQAGNLPHMNSNMPLQQNQVHWPSSTSKEQKIAVSSSITPVKQEPFDQSNEQLRGQFSSSHGLSSAPVKQGSTVTALTSLGHTNTVSSSTIASPMEINNLTNSRMPSLTSPSGPGSNSKVPPKKPLAGQKKPMETPCSSPPSSKKQKVSGGFLDQSIEHLNDVTAVSGVNLREEEEQLFSGPKEDSRVSEASRRVVQEEEERLLLQKIPLQKKVVEIIAKCGLKNMSSDVERCLSLCVEERMRGLISNVIRLSKQRVDVEKPRHKTIITSNVKKKIMTINRKAREEWEKKQAEIEKSQKPSEPESITGVDGEKEKDDSRGKSTKANKEEDDKMRAAAANVAVRAATGVDDMMSRWQLMVEAKQKQGGSEASSASQPAKDVGRKASAASTRNSRENQESEKRDPSASFTTPASIRKLGRNQVVIPRVARSIAVKDVIGVLEREPQMSKSTLLYSLYNKVNADGASDYPI